MSGQSELASMIGMQRIAATFDPDRYLLVSCSFEVWPYLEQFAIDVANEIQTEMGGKPDLLIGNYSDGNLVATLLSHYMNVTQANIAHALEKTKYQDADVNWCVIVYGYVLSAIRERAKNCLVLSAAPYCRVWMQHQKSRIRASRRGRMQTCCTPVLVAIMSCCLQEGNGQ